MLEGTRIAVVVPACDEARLIARTLASIPPFVDHIIVIDDASIDDTAACAASTGDDRVEVLRHPTNRGVGAAIATGYAHAFASGADIAAVMAGDAQMDPSDLPALLAPILRGEAGYAKGDRLSFPGARTRMPWPRWIGNHVLTILTRIATGLPIRDSQCGYTALARHAAHQISWDHLWPRYGYPNDLLGALAAANVPVRDVTVKPIYADETSGIGIRHALFVIPYVLLRIIARRTFTPKLAASSERTYTLPVPSESARTTDLEPAE